jgi:hypothetical protein
MKLIFCSSLISALVSFLVFVGLRVTPLGEQAMLGLFIGMVVISGVGLVVYMLNNNERWAKEFIVAALCASLMIAIASGFGGIYFGLGFAFFATLLAMVTVGYERSFGVWLGAGASMAALAFPCVFAYDAYYRSTDSWFFGVLTLTAASILSYFMMRVTSDQVVKAAHAG